MEDDFYEVKEKRKNKNKQKDNDGATNTDQPNESKQL